MTLIKDLGLIAGMIKSNTAPTNTEIFWYDSASNIQKYYNTNTSTWEPLVGSSSSLQNTLIAGNTTSGNNIIISQADKIRYKLGTFFGDILMSNITANRNYSLPDKSGTIAMISDIAIPLTDILATSELTGNHDIDFAQNQNGLTWETINNNFIRIDNGGANVNTEGLTFISPTKNGIYFNATDIDNSGDWLSMRINPSTKNIEITANTGNYGISFNDSGQPTSSHTININQDVFKLNIDGSSGSIRFSGGGVDIMTIDNSNSLKNTFFNKFLAYGSNIIDGVPASGIMDIGDISFLHFTDTSAHAQGIVIKGLSHPSPGRVLTIYNNSIYVLQMNHNFAGVGGQRIKTFTGNTISIPSGASGSFIYDDDSSSWIMITPTA